MDNTQQSPLEQEVLETSPKPIQKHRLRTITILALLLIAVMFGSYLTYSNNLIKSNNQVSQTKPLPSPSITPIKKFNVPNLFVPYKKLSMSAVGELATFSDSTLSASFSYPDKYITQSVPASERDLRAFIFFLNERNKEKETSLANVVECILNNRIVVGGVCMESMIGDVQVFIQPENSSKIPPKSTEYLIEHNNCEKELIANNKILYSCIDQLSVNPEDIGMSYFLYLTGQKQLSIKISTRNATESSGLIMQIIKSIKVLD